MNKNVNKKLITDSKKLSTKKRLKSYLYIIKNSKYAIGRASVSEIEKKNILQATLLSMKRAIKKLNISSDLILIDGNKIPKIKNLKIKSIVKGDEKILSISAASIIAKVVRDKYILKLSEKYNGYSWNTNFGYGTKKHRNALKKLGVTKHHRKSFKPIHNILNKTV